MKEEQNNFTNESSTSEEELKTNQSGWKKVLRKKWFFPAVYLASAALILALITWYQSPNEFALDPEQPGTDPVQQQEEDAELDVSFENTQGDEDAIPVTTGDAENMVWPYANDEDVQIVLGYFDDQSSEEEQMAAMVEYEQSFSPHQGVDFSLVDGEAFNVLAALGGTVIVVDKEPLTGNYVEIEHKNGLITVYQSLEDVQVAEGDTVQQGDVIAVAGRNSFEQDLGVHLHFEVRKDGVSVNPDQYLATSE